MPNRTFKPVYGLMLAFGMAGPALTQDNGPTQHNGGLPPSAREQLSHIHTPQSIDQELVRLTKDLELAPEQQSRVRALLDENPNASRQELGPRIHAISDETHREIHALLSDRQRQLEQAMRQREHHGEEGTRPGPPAASPRALQPPTAETR